MTTKGEGQIPTPGGAVGSEKRRSLLPAPKSGHTKSTNLSCTPDVVDSPKHCQPLTIDTGLNLKVGDRVSISGIKCGVLHFVGKTKFAEGDWCGIELDDPEGKHGGVVDGVEYFSCGPLHGIFAPLCKVVAISDVKGSVASSVSPASSCNSAQEQRSPSPGKSHRLPQLKARARSASPQASEDSGDTSGGDRKSLSPPTKKPSKLSRPKAAIVGKSNSGAAFSPFQEESNVCSDSPQDRSLPTSRDNTKLEASKSKLAKLSSQGRSLPQRPGTRSSQDSNNNQPASAIPQSGIAKPKSQLKQPQYGKAQVKNTDLGKTFTIKSKAHSQDEEDSVPDIVSPCRVDPHTALTLAYDLEGSGSDSEFGKQLSSVPTRGNYESQHPLPDLVSPSTRIAKTLSSDDDFLFDDTPDALFTSQISTVSSIGILTEEELAQNSLLPDEEFLTGEMEYDYSGIEVLVPEGRDLDKTFEANGNQTVTGDDTPLKEGDRSMTESSEMSDSNDTMEKEIDNEISGISTPDVDFPSSASKEGSSPEPDHDQGEPDLAYQDALTKKKKFNSPSKEDGTAGEKMASPVKENGNGFKQKQNSFDSENDNTELVCVTGETASDTVVVMREKKVNPVSTDSETSPEDFPKRMRTSADFDDVDTASMTASFELAKTAVSQYAQLVKAAEEEKRKSMEKDVKRASQNLEDVLEQSDEGSESDATDTVTTIDRKRYSYGSEDTLDTGDFGSQAVSPDGTCPTEPMDTVSQSELDEETDQLIADLQAGHQRSERPVSMISTGSADTGIVADFSHTAGSRKERPVSLISTSSVDTGYVPDTDSEIGTLTTNSPLDVTSPPGLRSSPSPPRDHFRLDTTTNISHSSHRQTSAVKPKQLAESDSDLYLSDGTMMADSEVDREETDREEVVTDKECEETSGTESQQDEERDLRGEADSSEESGNEVVTVEDLRATTPRQELDESVRSQEPTGDTPEGYLVDLPSADPQVSLEAKLSEADIVRVLDFTHVEPDDNMTLHNQNEDIVPVKEREAEPTNKPVEKNEPPATNVTDSQDLEEGEFKIKMEQQESPKEVSKEEDCRKDSEKQAHKLSTAKKTSKPISRKADLSSEKTDVKKKAETAKRTNSKNTSTRIVDFIKKPQVAKTKDEIENSEAVKNPKLTKNATNRKMSNSSLEKSPTKTAVDKLSKLSSPRDAKMSKGKLEISSNQRTVEVRPVIVQLTRPAAVKRHPPKSKWENIMSQIDNNKEKPKPEAAKPNRPSSANNKPASTSGSSSGAIASRRISSGNVPTSAPDKPKRKSSMPARLLPPKSVMIKRASPEPSSRKSSSSDVSGQDQRTYGVPLSRGRPASASRPSNRTTTTLRKVDRSSSVGSDSQESSASDSSISQVSMVSQGSLSNRSPQQGTPRQSTPEPKRSIAKRKSLIEPPRTSVSKIEPRRSSLVAPGSSRMALAKSPRTPGSQAASPAKKPSLTKDQTRNKAGRPSKNHLKHTNQPDLVSNAIDSSQASEEISRLEALCESRTKELNYIKLQLKQKNTGFEAMAILVKYLTQELDAFSCPVVTAQLQETKEQLVKAKQHLDVTMRQRDALIDEIQCLKQQHQDETDKLENDHKEALSSLEERLKKEREDAVNEVVDRHSKEVTTLKSYHERNLAETKLEHEKLMGEKEKEHQEALTKADQDYKQKLAELQKKHETQLEEITVRFEHIKVTLSEKVEYLRNECEEMRRREKTYMEACKRDTERKVQVALTPYKHIQQEIESLKAVLELRNQEIRELRLQKAAVEKQLEQLPVARDQVTRLQQKVENLEAILDIKSDYEKQLAEKHHGLIRRYDRESKANKRLSMDNEELAWRLSQSADSPDMFRRSISHSPTQGETPTTDPLRRRKSPLPPQSPRSPNGMMSRSADFDRSPAYGGKRTLTPITPTDKSPPRTSLKRSGTYELLDQEFSDEEKLPQSDV